MRCLGVALAGILLSTGVRSADVAEGDQDHRIAPLDIINVTVVGEKDLTLELRVSSGGTITYPYLGSLAVKDLTTAELETALKEKLREGYLVDPQVVVTVKEYRQRNVSVIGQVNRPSVVTLPAEQRMDILEAIAAAGGLTAAAKKSGIEVIRQGQKKPYRFKLDDLKKESDPEKKFWLEPGDVINVEESVF